jgi:hypothetical protein
MANFIDSSEEEVKNEEEQQTQDELSFEEEESQVEEAQTEEPQQEEDDDIPEKYRGKSVKDIIKMHQEVEKAFGRQGSEIGELKRQFQQFQEAQTVAKQAPDVEEEIDFLDNPEKFVESKFEKKFREHPKFKELEQISQQMKAAQALTKLQQAHPDYTSIVNDEKFVDWVKASSVRTKLMVQADQEYDFDAADELLSIWKERNQIVAKKTEENKQQRKQAIKEAATGSAVGSAEPRSKKYYRHADIENLNLRDPERYMALQPEIMAAYAEGRVRR